MSTDDSTSQSDEMMAMESIYDSTVFQLHEGDLRSGVIKVQLDLPSEPFHVVVNAGNENETRYKVEYLPPLVLHFTLPKNYPSTAKPNFTLSSCWLHRGCLSILCQKLDTLWMENEGQAVLFTWVNELQSTSLTELCITDHYDVAWHSRPSNLRKHHNLTLTEESEPTTPSTSKRKKRRKNTQLPSDPRAVSEMIPRNDNKEVSLLDYLLSHNESRVRENFLHSTHSCDICFSMKSGNACVRFRCAHVFCEDCVRASFRLHIEEGAVDSVKCLAFNCKMRPTPECVKEVVGAELFTRYDEILLKRALENMEDIVYCPRPKCLAPVICDKNEEKLAWCNACNFTFCSICKAGWHGLNPCRFKDADMKAVFKKYTEGSAEEKKELLRTYGEKQLNVLVENVLSEQWIQNESKACPHCNVPIEKFEGCNKVTCFKCHTYFCWICLKQLETGNPYFHFNDPTSKCYNNLFQDVNAPADNWFQVDDGDSDDSDFDDLEFDSDYDDDDYYE